jgi:ABC-type transporter Mla subunit MlaD
LSRAVSPFKIGLLIIIGGSLALILVIWLGASHYFEEKKTYVSFFAESVKGLREDAQVNYRGVAVGRVARVGLAPDGRLIRVVMYLKPGFKVDESLAIRIKQQGLTGLRYLEIDTAPPDIRELTPKLEFEPKHPVIPSYPSDFKQVYRALETLYTKITELDLKNLVEEWKSTASLLNESIRRAQVDETFQNVKQASMDLAKFARELDAYVEAQDIGRAVAAFHDASDSAGEFFGVLGNEESQKTLREVVKDLGSTVDAAERSARLLAAQMEELPPGKIAGTVNHLDDSLVTLDKSLETINKRLDESFVSLQQNLYELRQLSREVTRLVQNLRENPSRILYRPEESEPFQRK